MWALQGGIRKDFGIILGRIVKYDFFKRKTKHLLV